MMRFGMTAPEGRTWLPDDLVTACSFEDAGFKPSKKDRRTRLYSKEVASFSLAFSFSTLGENTVVSISLRRGETVIKSMTFRSSVLSECIQECLIGLEKPEDVRYLEWVETQRVLADLYATAREYTVCVLPLPHELQILSDCGFRRIESGIGRLVYMAKTGSGDAFFVVFNATLCSWSVAGNAFQSNLKSALEDLLPRIAEDSNDRKSFAKRKSHTWAIASKMLSAIAEHERQEAR